MKRLKSFYQRKRNKKGSLDDFVYVMGIILVAGLLFLIFGKWSDSFNTRIQTMDAIPDEGKAAISKVDDLYGGAIDNSFLLLTVGLCIAALIFAMLVVVHPVFFVLYLIVLSIVIYLAGIFSNIYQAAATHPEMAPIAEKLIFTSHVLTYLPFIIGVLGCVLAIVMYKTWEESR